MWGRYRLVDGLADLHGRVRHVLSLLLDDFDILSLEGRAQLLDRVLDLRLNLLPCSYLRLIDLCITQL